MRSNLPITNQEYVLKETETIVSKTDLHGNITYVNDDFLRISGFTAEELIGQPHNIVRHPEMPEAAFADMWRNLRAGKAWTGLVKNRCKNGDHYWVEANAAPLIENHKIVGYTSVRGKPSRAQIQAADEAYRAIQAGSKSLIIRDGEAVSSASSFSPLRYLRNLSIGTRLWVWMGTLIALFGINILLAFLMTANEHGNTPTYVIGASILGIGIALFATFGLQKNLIRPLTRAVVDITQMSSGDLTGRIAAPGNDEIARMMQALRVLQINVKLLIGQISEATDYVNSGANEIAAGNLDLSARTESQASSLEQTASAMEQLTATVKQNAENAMEATQLVVSTSDIAVRGGESVSQVVDTMGSIKDSSRKIVDIISLIDGIAFQTNILALNAAVEAARAGEQGRGFAVVATEVRSLAQRSAAAAREIQTLILDTVSRVDNGAAIVDNAGRTMDEIVNSVKQAASIMNDIAASSKEQSTGIEEVNAAIAQMDEITQQNAALVEQAAAAATTMKQQSDKLTTLVDSFKIMSGSKPQRAESASVAKPSQRLATKPASAQARPKATALPAPRKQINSKKDDDWEQF